MKENIDLHHRLKGFASIIEKGFHNASLLCSSALYDLANARQECVDGVLHFVENKAKQVFLQHYLKEKFPPEIKKQILTELKSSNTLFSAKLTKLLIDGSIAIINCPTDQNEKKLEFCKLIFNMLCFFSCAAQDEIENFFKKKSRDLNKIFQNMPTDGNWGNLQNMPTDGNWAILFEIIANKISKPITTITESSEITSETDYSKSAHTTTSPTSLLNQNYFDNGLLKLLLTYFSSSDPLNNTSF
jgi:hypothetical protein